MFTASLQGGRVRPLQGIRSHLQYRASGLTQPGCLDNPVVSKTGECARIYHPGRRESFILLLPRLQPLQVSENCLNFYRYPAMKSITKRAQDTLAAITFLKPHIRWEIKI